MDYSTLQHPKHFGVKPKAVYIADRVLVEFEDQTWGLWIPEEGVWITKDGKTYFCREEMYLSGWEPYMKNKPIWTTDRLTQETEQLVSEQLDQSELGIWKSEKYKYEYFYGNQDKR